MVSPLPFKKLLKNRKLTPIMWVKRNLPLRSWTTHYFIS